MTAIGNLVQQTTTSEGTGNLTLVTSSGRQSFNDAFGTGGTDAFYYFVMHRTAAEWEVGTGHLLDATTLVRDTVINSSNADAAVNFSAGTKDVTNAVAASDVAQLVNLASTANGRGASLIGIEDSGALIAATTVEGALAEIASDLATNYQPLDADLTTWAGITPGTGVGTALAVNVGTAGAFVVNGGALGTPSSGTLTNATGLPISTGVSGLGTGVATFLATPSSANLAAFVTGATGSGALVFGTSPTISGPTFTGNVTLPSGIWNSSGNVGIGTASPTGSALHVYSATTDMALRVQSGDANVGISLIDNTTSGTNSDLAVRRTGNDVQLWTSGNQRLTIDSSGNVGIGTTSPSQPLHVVVADGGYIRVEGGAGAVGEDSYIAFQGARAAVGYDGARGAAYIGDGVVGGTATKHLVFDTAGSERMRISTAGNVGIGTESPGVLFDVQSSSATAVARVKTSFANANAELYLTSDGSGDSVIRMGNAAGASNGLIYYDANANFMVFRTAATDRVRIDSSGNVGIGTTSPGRKLDVIGGRLGVGSGDNYALVLAYNETRLDAGQCRYIGATDSASPDLIISSSGGGTALVTISNSGSLRLHSYGAGTLTTDASGNVTATSDERLKENIEPYARGLDDVQSIAPITYSWNAASGLDRLNRYAGFSAQNIEQAIPESIGVNADGYLSVQERPILAALVNAVKELAARVAALEAP